MVVRIDATVGCQLAYDLHRNGKRGFSLSTEYVLRALLIKIADDKLHGNW